MAPLALAPFQQWGYVLMSLKRQLAAGIDLAHLPVANWSAATLRLRCPKPMAADYILYCVGHRTK